MTSGMAGAIARIMVYTLRPHRLSFHAPRGVAERRRQAVQYAASPDAPRYRVVSWVDFRVSLAVEILSNKLYPVRPCSYFD